MLVYLTNAVEWTPVAMTFAKPVLIIPELVPRALVGISLPLALTVIGAEKHAGHGYFDD
jgi:predicted benzoate:H+ symporter BenE